MSNFNEMLSAIARQPAEIKNAMQRVALSAGQVAYVFEYIYMDEMERILGRDAWALADKKVIDEAKKCWGKAVANYIWSKMGMRPIPGARIIAERLGPLSNKSITSAARFVYTGGGGTAA